MRLDALKGIVWFNNNQNPKGEQPGPLDADPYKAMPSFLGRPTMGVEVPVPWYVRMLPFWGHWKNIAIDMKALYEAMGESWPPKVDPRYEDASQFLEITLK
jgi:hypothetical protein